MGIDDDFYVAATVLLQGLTNEEKESFLKELREITQEERLAMAESICGREAKDIIWEIADDIDKEHMESAYNLKGEEITQYNEIIKDLDKGETEIYQEEDITNIMFDEEQNI